MMKSLRTVVVLAAFGAAATAPAAEPPADLILSGGRVWTADAARPWAESVAVRGDRIVFVGPSTGADAFRGPKTQVIELAGRLVTPGFNDAHLHLVSGAVTLERVDLIEAQDTAAVQKAHPHLRRRQPAASVGAGARLAVRLVPGRPADEGAARRRRLRPPGVHGLLRRAQRLGELEGAGARRDHEGHAEPAARRDREGPEDGRAHGRAEGSGDGARREGDPEDRPRTSATP